MSLADYLDDVAGRDCAYGELDCAILMADWIVICGFADPMPDRRGTYADKRSFRRALKSEGGLLASCKQRFERIGMNETTTPKAGDVAIVMAPFAQRSGRWLRRPTGALVLAGGLAALLDWPRGICGAHLPIAAAWSVSRG
jgi:hypothetical protein